MTELPRWHRARANGKGGIALVLGFVFVFAAVAFGVVGTVHYGEAAQANESGVEVIGTVVDVTEQHRRVNRRSKVYSVATVEYRTTTGETLTTEFSRRDPVHRNAYEVGETFTLVYNSDDPSKVVLAGGQGWAASISALAAGGVFAVLATVLLIVGRRRMRG